MFRDQVTAVFFCPADKDGIFVQRNGFRTQRITAVDEVIGLLFTGDLSASFTLDLHFVGHVGHSGEVDRINVHSIGDDRFLREGSSVPFRIRVPLNKDCPVLSLGIREFITERFAGQDFLCEHRFFTRFFYEVHIKCRDTFLLIGNGGLGPCIRSGLISGRVSLSVSTAIAGMLFGLPIAAAAGAFGPGGDDGPGDHFEDHRNDQVPRHDFHKTLFIHSDFPHCRPLYGRSK